MKGAVAAGHRATAAAAAEILRAGGNAFDAAVGGFFAACVAEPALASLGGGGYLLARERGGRAGVFDFFTHTPSAPPRADIDFHPVTVDFGAAQQVFHIGAGACAVPGAVRGVFDVHRAYGKLPMQELIRPAIELARDGIEVNGFQSYLLELLAPIFRTDSALPLYKSAMRPGKLLQPGDVFCNPPLADALQALAVDGDALFYEGEIAARIVDACAGGGYLTRDDLTNYRVHRRAPLVVDYRGRRLLTNPAPSAGGLLVAFGLAFLKAFELGKRGLEFGGAAAVNALVDAQLATCRLRDDVIDDNAIDPRLIARRGTTHLSVIDAARNIASLSVSNGEGCGRVVDGFMLNNMLGEEDVNPRGFHKWRPNMRMASMMAPTVIAAHGALTALGSGGSNRIRSALLQVISNLADFRMTPSAAVAAPRLHVESDSLCMEVGFPDASIRAARDTIDLGGLGDHRVFDAPHMFFGGVHLAHITRHGKLSAVGDARRDGVGVTV